MDRVRHREADGVVRARLVSPQRNIHGVPARAVSYHDLLRPAGLKVRDTVLTFPPVSLCRQLLQSPGGTADLLQAASESIRSHARGPADEVGSVIAASSTGESQRGDGSPVRKGGPGVHQRWSVSERAQRFQGR